MTHLAIEDTGMLLFAIQLIIVAINLGFEIPAGIHMLSIIIQHL